MTDLQPAIPDAPLSTPAIAELLGVSRQAVSRWAKRGRLVATKHGDRYVVDPCDLETFLRSDWYCQDRGRRLPKKKEGVPDVDA